MFFASFFLFFYFLMGSFSLDIKGYNQIIERDVFFDKHRKINPKLSPNGDKIAFLSYDDSDALNLFLYDIYEKNIVCLTNNKINVHDFIWDKNSIIYLLDDSQLFEVNCLDKTNKFIFSFNNEIVELLDVTLDKLILSIEKNKLKDVCSIDLTQNDYEINVVFENISNITNYFLDKEALDKEAKVKAFLTENNKYEKSLFVKNKDKYIEIISNEKDLSIVALYDNDNIVFRKNNDFFCTSFNEKDALMKKLCSVDNFEIIIDPQSKHLIAIYDLNKKKIVFNQNNTLLHMLSKYNNGIIKLIDKSINNKFLVRYANDNTSVKFYLFDEKNNKAQFVFSDNAQLERFIVPNIKKFSIKDKNDASIDFFLSLPIAKNTALPLVVLFAKEKDAYMRWLANRGYAILTFSENNFFPKDEALILSNILEVKKYLVKNNLVEPSKSAIIADDGIDMQSVISMLTLAPMDFTCASINCKKEMKFFKSITYLNRPILINSYNNINTEIIDNKVCSIANNKNSSEYLYNIEKFLNLHLRGALEQKK